MTQKVSIDLIKELRDRTGAGLSDCKNALAESDLDIEKAIIWLREKGITKVAKKAGRIAAEGRSLALVDGNSAVIYEVNSETDFVSESPAFLELAQKIGSLLLSNKPATLEEGRELVQPTIVDYTVKLGEKLDLRRFTILTKTDDEVFGSYVHMGGKIASLLKVEGGTEEQANDIAMCLCSFLSFQYIKEEDIPGDARKVETEIQRKESENDPKFASKPEEIKAKIIEGKVNKILAESVFLDFEYIRDPSKKIKEVLKGYGQTIVEGYRFQTGEGIEKRVDDFASEVAAQLK